MTRTTSLLAALLALTLATAVPAQQTTAPVVPAPEAPAAAATDAPAVPAATDTPAAPAPDDLALGKPVTEDGVGSTYVEAKFGDWDQRCVRTADGANPCQLYQLLLDATKNPVAEFSVFGLPAGGQAVAGLRLK